MGDLSELNEKHYDDLSQDRNTKTFSMRESQAQPSVDCLDIALDDLEVISTLGVGGFGRVELVKVKSEIRDHVICHVPSNNTIKTGPLEIDYGLWVMLKYFL